MAQIGGLRASQVLLKRGDCEAERERISTSGHLLAGLCPNKYTENLVKDPNQSKYEHQEEKIEPRKEGRKMEASWHGLRSLLGIDARYDMYNTEPNVRHNTWHGFGTEVAS